MMVNTQALNLCGFWNHAETLIATVYYNNHHLCAPILKLGSIYCRNNIIAWKAGCVSVYNILKVASCFRMVSQ